jgi:glycosyltransferase involved in cell wall biosynthesis
MKILQVVPVFSDPFGGPVTVVRSISKELAKRHEVVVYTTTALDPKHDFDPHQEESNGYKVLYFRRTFKTLCHTGIIGQLNLSYSMMRSVNQNLREFDLVHVHSWQQFPDIMVHHYAMKYNIPYVLQVHGSIPKIGKKVLKTVYDIFFGKRILNDASKLIALSAIESKQYLQVHVPKEKIAIIPNGVDFEEFAYLPPRGAFKKKFGIALDMKIILYLGRIHQTKGLDLLITAYSHLSNDMKIKDTMLVIAGPDDGYLGKAKELARSLNISHLVLFAGFLGSKDKQSALVDATVFATPSFYGFPLTFLEACAAGTPIITTTFGDFLDWINGYVGYVTSPNFSELAEAMKCIICDDELRNFFSYNCRSIVASDFSAGRVTGLIEQVYHDVLETRDGK